ncbi:GNAT family N-acetyltransferase [Pontibacter akesuensis]|uniref:N-acetyltransferase, GNAT superfamily (Includes histone acetyltransferase HPA2) n=1 Tax=Pontibacter akesuensis TaxID=388950 RepID=A0A1I7FPR2_9BACT|nr:GNAT family N-acetyltransferase [Pontibacter akesuensis]GHA61072.1 N-acetyltransferase [Pontibacter akesuensis]SFU38207.1 N-acetyltransferase, GNAT superfamily (includes histone acetyltransferase HPA2) [Pontibacter akesuensis]
MINIIRTDSGNKDFHSLVALLDRYLQQKDGEDHSFFAQYNKLDKIHHVLVVYKADVPVGCGAIKEYAPGTMEVKRMFVQEQHRGQGIAILVLQELEKWAAELGYTSCILETGRKMPEAVRLYQKSGYTSIPNYGQYAGVESSICMQKVLGVPQ